MNDIMIFKFGNICCVSFVGRLIYDQYLYIFVPEERPQNYSVTDFIAFLLHQKDYRARELEC